MRELTENADDLVLYIDNTSKLYTEIKVKVDQFLAEQMREGKYVRDLARKGYSILVDQGLIAYRSELKIAKHLTKSEREAVISEYVCEFEDTFMVENFDTYFTV